MIRYLNILLSASVIGLMVCSSCNQKPANSEEETRITVMDSTSREVKEHTEKLEEQTKKVEESLEKLDKEFKTEK